MQKNKTQHKRSVFHWHRQLGLAVSILVIILSITGILLNHTEEFELDSSYIKSEFLLKWYGINKPVINSYSTGENWISHVGNTLYFNDVLVEKEITQLTGAIAMENFIAVATQDELILLSHDGEKIERINATAGVPGNIISIGKNRTAQLFLKTRTAIFQSNNDVTEWTRSKDKNITWATTSNLPNKLESSLNTLFRGTGLSKERVLLDLHSGRILGKAGPLLIDLSAILLLILSLTGCWMYAKRSWTMHKRNLLLAAADKGNAYSAADLKRGDEGIVLTVIGDETLRQRLAAMGVMAGTVIATPAASIFGDPRTYLVRGYQLSMRTTEAAMILLQTDEQTMHELEKASKDDHAVETEKK